MIYSSAKTATLKGAVKQDRNRAPFVSGKENTKNT
jgi:hypothetical protein